MIKKLILFLSALMLMPLLITSAQAHLMVAQRGTLNFAGDGAFMVLSLPVSAFQGVDENADGMLSATEFGLHRHEIAAQISAKIRLSDAQGPLPLQGIMITPSLTSEASPHDASQLVVMGRYPLRDTASPFLFTVNLFGTAAPEQRYTITTSRRSSSERNLIMISPEQNQIELFPSDWSVFTTAFNEGAHHILAGLDHLLFLLLVLAAGWGWRQILLALTAFTLGHAITLTISTTGWFSIDPAMVEPAIAATIVIIALYDLAARRYTISGSAWWRMALVFGCALIHGLGLASAFSEFELSRQNLLINLAGFNLGIEAGQLGVVIIVAAIALVIRRWFGETGLNFMTRGASLTAIGAGSFWFVQRVLS